jgi:hypothetical protein
MSGTEFNEKNKYDIQVIENPSLFNSETSHVKNVLIGNGFGLSHPDLSSAFKWDMHEALSLVWSTVLPRESSGDPESDLSSIRIAVLKLILEFYIRKLFEAMGEVPSFDLSKLYKSYKNISIKYSCSLLDFRETIFSLNYDPILYFEILKKKEYFFDGFITRRDNGYDPCFTTSYPGIEYANFERGNGGFLKQDYVKCKLEKYSSKEKAKVFHLHGAWFIITNDENEIRKLSCSEANHESVDMLFEKGVKPFLVLEDRCAVKKALLEDLPEGYLEFCYYQLKNISGELIIFGCSLKCDDHILDAIRLNEKITKIHVTYIDDHGLERAKKNYTSEKVGRKQVILYKVGRSEIWRAK